MKPFLFIFFIRTAIIKTAIVVLSYLQNLLNPEGHLVNLTINVNYEI